MTVKVCPALFFATCLFAGPGSSVAASGAPAAPSTAPRRVDYSSGTIFTENDLYTLGTPSDRYYTTGQKFTRISDRVENFADAFETRWVQFLARHASDRAEKTTEREQRRVGAPLYPAPASPTPPPAQLRVAFSLGQNMFTPADTHTPALQAHDRPYAAWLYLSTALQARSTSTEPRAWLSVWGADIGLVGPDALGKQIQNFVHDRISHSPRAQGWQHQLSDEPGLNLFHQAKLRWFAGDRRGFGGDLIAHGGFSLGNVSTYANAGATVRFGVGLPDDFGTDPIRSGADTSQAGGIPPRWGAHVFAGFDGRLVGRNIFLDGNTFAHSHHVTRETFVGDVQFGVAFTFRRWTLCLSQVRRTPEFKLQDHAQAYGSIALTFPLSGAKSTAR